MGFQDAVNSGLVPNPPTSGFVGGTQSYYVPNAGLFGAGANLPGNSGPPDPFVEPTPLPGTQQNYPNPTPAPTNYAAYPPPGYGSILSLLDRYGVGGNGPSGGNSSQPSGSGGGGYVPSNIMQAYLDFYTNNPVAGGATAPNAGGGDTAYPAPGTGAPRQSGQSFLGRLLGSTPAGALINLLRGRPGDIPAVQLARSIGNLFNPPQSVHDNASSNSTPGPPGGGIAGGAGVTPADQSYRFSNNGTTGNFQADQTTKAFELGGGYPGTPNRVPGTSDRGKDRFQMNAVTPPMQYDEETGFTPAPQDFSPAAIAQQTASRDLYQQALKAIPMGTDGFTLPYVQKLNDWIRAHQTADIFNPRTPPGTISGPPALQPFGSSNSPLMGGGG